MVKPTDRDDPKIARRRRLVVTFTLVTCSVLVRNELVETIDDLNAIL